MTPLRIGTLGAARITPPALLAPASKRDDVEVVAVAARDRTRAQSFADKRDIPRVLDDYEAVITDDAIDAVYVPLPNSHHAEWTIAAIEAGKHVLCEKPFTADADEARRVAAVAAAHPDVVVMEAFHWRYHPLAQAVIDELRAGTIGDVEHIDAHFSIPLLPPGDIRWRPDLAGGALMDVGCYTISMLRHFAGAEPTVRTATAKQRTPGVDRRIDATFSFDDGSTGSITASMLSRSLLWVSATVQGSQGRVRILNPVAPQVFHRCTIETPDGKRRLHFPRSATSYGGQLDAFVTAVRDGGPVLTPPEDAIANMAVIDAVYRAAGMEPRPARTG